MRNKGFTLIEVLISLLILSIALTAIMKATSQNIQDTLYLQNKTIATWVGMEIIAQAQIGLLNLSTSNDQLSHEADMLGQKWTWQASVVTTPNPRIREFNIDVYSADHQKKWTHLTSYIYAP